MQPPFSTFLSYHGTLLCHDVHAENLALAPLRGRQDYRKIVVLPSGELGGSAAALTLGRSHFTDGRGQLGEIELVAGLLAGTLALKKQDRFATALPNGSISWDSRVCLHWESFLPVAPCGLALIDQLLRCDWRHASGQRLLRAKIAIGEAYRLHVGGDVVDLSQGLGASDAMRPGVIVLEGIDGPLTLTKKATDEERGSGRRPRTIHVEPHGNMANRALQYLAAKRIQTEVHDVAIDHVRLPEWNVERNAPKPPRGEVHTVPHGSFSLDMDGLCHLFREGVFDALVLDTFPFSLDNFPSREECRTILQPFDDYMRFDPDQLVCSVRSNEILHGIHSHYFALPAAYYRTLAAESGLALVFYGQLQDNAYTHYLKRHFPDALFLCGRDPLYDFETLRRAPNVALSISTFAWLAAWLGHADRIFLPVAGLFNPTINPRQRFLPLDTAGYFFHLMPQIPVPSIVPSEDAYFRSLDCIGSGIEPIEVADLAAVQDRAVRASHVRTHLGGFDATAYVDLNPSVAPTICSGQISALDHFTRFGSAEGRRAAFLDDREYLLRDPEAALLIAKGLFANAADHFMREGWKAPHQA